jgi:hypothetical protein
LSLDSGTKFRAIWDVAPCSHVEVHRRFRGVYNASIIRAVNFIVTTRRYIPEDSKLHTRRRKEPVIIQDDSGSLANVQIFIIPFTIVCFIKMIDIYFILLTLRQ